MTVDTNKSHAPVFFFSYLNILFYSSFSFETFCEINIPSGSKSVWGVNPIFRGSVLDWVESEVDLKA